MARRRYDSPRDVGLLLTARGIALLLDSFLTVALVLRVEASGAGPWANAGLMIALAVPSVALMRWAGRVADRRDSRWVLTVAVAIQIIACLVLATPVAVRPGWVLSAACVVFQTGFTFANPIWMVLVPRIAGEEGVQRLSGNQMLISSVATPWGRRRPGSWST